MEDCGGTPIYIEYDKKSEEIWPLLQGSGKTDAQEEAKYGRARVKGGHHLAGQTLHIPPEETRRGYLITQYGDQLSSSERSNCEVGWSWPAQEHGRILPVLRYHQIIAICPNPFLVVITPFFSCIIFLND